MAIIRGDVTIAYRKSAPIARPVSVIDGKAMMWSKSWHRWVELLPILKRPTVEWYEIHTAPTTDMEG